MDSLGDYLKKARKKKKVSLKQVEAQTRIQEHHLQALEDEDFASLPAKVFAKGFVRSYAKALDLDEEEALQCFLQASGTFYEQHQSEHPQPHAQVRLEAAPRQGPDWKLVFGLILVIAIGAIWYGLPEKPDTQIVLSEPETSSSTEPLQDDPIPPRLIPKRVMCPFNLLSRFQHSQPHLLPSQSRLPHQPLFRLSPCLHLLHLL